MYEKVSDERFKAFLQLSTKYYSWDIILQNAGISEVADKGDQYEIRCILHEDKRPSLRLNKITGVYHCFSCGAAGTYTKFLWELNGRNIPYANFCEQILKSNPAMANQLGFSSLFVDEKTLNPEFKKRRVFNPKAHLGSSMPITVLAQQVRAVDDTWENLVLSHVLLQQGVEPDGILAVVKKQHIEVEKPEARVSLLDLI